MCFSASASFGTSAVLAASGLFSLSKVRDKTQIMFAAIPLFFGLQQSIEGCIWLNIQAQGSIVVLKYLALGYLFFAHIFWPLWIPLSLFLLETSVVRKCLLIGILLIGILFVAMTLTAYHDFMPQVIDGHLVYGIYPVSIATNTMYLVATIAPFFVMQGYLFKIIGGVVGLALLASWWFFYAALGSIWCFFAALVSALIVVAMSYLRTRGRA